LINNYTKRFIDSLRALLITEGLELESRFVDAAGPVRRIHYLEYGKGEPLILVHGGGANCSIWFSLIRRLRDHFHLYILDRPGCGLSNSFSYKGVDMATHPSDFLNSFMDALQLKKASFAGASIGGYFITRFAYRNPDRIKQLIFLGTPTGLESGVTIPRKLLSIKNLNTFIRNSLKKPTYEGSKRMFKNFLVNDASQLPEQLYQCYHLGGLIPGAESSYRSLLMNMVSINGNGFIKKRYWINTELSDISKPVLFIWGDKDLLASPELGKKTILDMKSGRVETISDAGHAPWLDKPDECALRIVEFSA
jgi:pimeloyl-ACP methyl ester carboxylesterase